MRRIALVAVLALFAAWLSPTQASQQTFATPEAAMEAFGDAVARNDDERMKAMLGEDYHAFIPPVGTEVRYRFLAGWARSHSAEPS